MLVANQFAGMWNAFFQKFLETKFAICTKDAFNWSTGLILIELINLIEKHFFWLRKWVCFGISASFKLQFLRANPIEWTLVVSLLFRFVCWASLSSFPLFLFCFFIRRFPSQTWLPIRPDATFFFPCHPIKPILKLFGLPCCCRLPSMYIVFQAWEGKSHPVWTASLCAWRCDWIKSAQEKCLII